MMNQLSFETNAQGMLRQLSSGGLRWELPADEITVTTDSGLYRLSQMPCQVDGSRFCYRSGPAEFTLEYAAVPGAPFLTRRLSMRFDGAVQLLKIAAAVPPAQSVFLYKTFVNASAAVFARSGSQGLCCGFENPYCCLEGACVAFEPSLILKAGEEFVSDLNFIGLYALSGELIQPELYRSEVIRNGRHQTRYRNPSEGVPLYFSEIRSFNDYTKHYFGCGEKEFRFGSYNFFSNLPQRPETQAHKQAYFRHIDNFCALGGDTIFLNPLVPNQIPNASPDSCWELFPQGTMAEEILNYAVSKGLRIGMYTGTAGNGCYGNSSMIPFADVKQWKKVDVRGHVSGENCLADDAFTDWYIQVQKNTIEKYHLSVWGWDPGPGNGMFCSCTEHGHLPQKGAYKGYRNCLRVMRELKEAFPDLYFLTFHGLKEYGMWGFKYIDQHEAIWENEVYVMAPAFADLSMDRATAHQIRLQSTWNYLFRFMPPALNHGIPHRMIQSCWMNLTELDSLVDYTGWKFGLLSSIAAGGSVTLPILPERPEAVDGYVEFYHKWIGWARDHFDYSKNTIPFGSQVGCGIDGFSKLIDNEGFLFLSNPFPVPLECSFTLDERLGFAPSRESCHLSMLHPLEQNLGATGYGQQIHLVVPEYEVLVLELSRREKDCPAPVTQPPLDRVLPAGGDGSFHFFADERIRALLERGQQYVSEKSIRAQDEYCQRFGRFNDCWTRPDRLWAWVCLEDYTGPSVLALRCNGQAVELKREILSHNDFRVDTLFFADITEAVRWGERNDLTLSPNPGKAVIYLSYLKPGNEALPTSGMVMPRLHCAAPWLDPAVQVLSAKLNDDNIMYPNRENTVTAQINLPAEELEGVYLTAPISIGATGFDLKSDMAMTYLDGKWVKSFQSDERIHLIIDDCRLSLWAVTKDGRESPALDVDFTWLL